MEMLEWDKVVMTIVLGIAGVLGSWVLLVVLSAIWPRGWRHIAGGSRETAGENDSYRSRGHVYGWRPPSGK